VTSPDFRDKNLAERVDILMPLLRDADAPFVVGSSYGGITALCAAIRHTEAGGVMSGLLLCAPALARAEPPATHIDLYAPCPIAIIHGVNDDVIPIEVSREFAANRPEVQLIEVDDDHRLHGSLDLIVATCRRLIS
jgi:alpha/beta superfamily hydrolase